MLNRTTIGTFLQESVRPSSTRKYRANTPPKYQHQTATAEQPLYQTPEATRRSVLPALPGLAFCHHLLLTALFLRIDWRAEEF